MNTTERARLCSNWTESVAAMGDLTYVEMTVRDMKPELWKIWGIGLAVITLCSFAPSVAITFLSCISKTTYNRMLTFLIGLGVGTLSGSALFILLPQAFHVAEMPSQDYVYKSWMTLGGVYMLFVIDKLIKFFFEIRKLQKAKSKIHEQKTVEPPTIEKLAVDREDYTFRKIKDGPLPLQLQQVVVGKQHEPEAKKGEEEASEIRSVAFMVLLGSWINNFVDGMSIGAAFAQNFIRGLSLGIAVLSQQFPQELASLAIVISSGLGLKKALLLNLIQAGLSYVGFIVGVLLDKINQRYDDIIFAISAGMYLYICLSVLIPEMSAKVNDHLQASTKEGLLTTVLQLFGIAFGLVFMFLMALYGGDIHF